MCFGLRNLESRLENDRAREQLSGVKSKESDGMYQRLADVVRRFDDIELLAQEIESIEESQEIETVDELTDFLEDELQYVT